MKKPTNNKKLVVGRETVKALTLAPVEGWNAPIAGLFTTGSCFHACLLVIPAGCA
jgi:hypothetical protein